MSLRGTALPDLETPPHTHNCTKCGATTTCYGGKGRPSRLETIGRNGRKLRWIISHPKEYDHICFKCGNKFPARQQYIQ